MSHFASDIENSNDGALRRAAGTVAYEIESRSAYVLARNLHLIDGWLFAVRRMADTQEHFEDVEFAATLLPGCYNEPPHRVIDGANHALHTLASAGCTEA